jgi:hypothetical protein
VHGERSFDVTVVRRHGLPANEPLDDGQAAGEQAAAGA